MHDEQASGRTPDRCHRIASVAIVVADLGLLAWGAMAALAPEHLAGPGGAPILAAGYAGYSKLSWQDLQASSPKAVEFMTVLFRVYGAYVAALGIVVIAIALTAFRRGEPWAWWTLLLGNTIAFASAMRYDWVVGAIGPFELTEYLGLAVIWTAHAFTAPFLMRDTTASMRAFGASAPR